MNYMIFLLEYTCVRDDIPYPLVRVIYDLYTMGLKPINLPDIRHIVTTTERLR